MLVGCLAHEGNKDRSEPTRCGVVVNDVESVTSREVPRAGATGPEEATGAGGGRKGQEEKKTEGARPGTGGKKGGTEKKTYYSRIDTALLLQAQSACALLEVGGRLATTTGLAKRAGSRDSATAYHPVKNV